MFMLANGRTVLTSGELDSLDLRGDMARLVAAAGVLAARRSGHPIPTATQYRVACAVVFCGDDDGIAAAKSDLESIGVTCEPIDLERVEWKLNAIRCGT